MQTKVQIICILGTSYRRTGTTWKRYKTDKNVKKIKNICKIFGHVKKK